MSSMVRFGSLIRFRSSFRFASRNLFSSSCIWRCFLSCRSASRYLTQHTNKWRREKRVSYTKQVLGVQFTLVKKTWKKANMLSGKLQTAFPSLQQSFQILERTRHRTTRSQEFWGAPDPMLRPVFLLVMLAHIAPLPKVFVFHA